MADPFTEYFLQPILSNGWFNPVNTITYAIGLIIGVYLVYKLLLKLKVPIDNKFILAVCPFVFWASSTRVLHDAAVAGALSPELNAFYIAPFFPTPGSYLITFGLALAALLISLLFQNFSRFPYWKAMFGIGAALCIVNMIIIPWVFPLAGAIVLGLTFLWTALFWVPRKFSPNLLSRENLSILSAHFLDASATFTALTFFGYLEQHVLPRALIDPIGPIVMFPLKIVVLLPVLYLIDRYAEDSQFKTLLKLVVLILGLAPGLRDVIRLMAWV